MLRSPSIKCIEFDIEAILAHLIFNLSESVISINRKLWLSTWSFSILFECAAAAAAKLLQSCLTLGNPIVDSPPGSPVPGILQARILEWVAMSSSRGSFQPRDQACISCIDRQVLYH